MTNAHVALTAALLTLAALLIPPPVGAATAQCDGGQFVRAYESGFVKFELDEFAAAAAWRPLAGAMFAPAQSQRGRIYATSIGLDADPERAFV